VGIAPDDKMVVTQKPALRDRRLVGGMLYGSALLLMLIILWSGVLNEPAALGIDVVVMGACVFSAVRLLKILFNLPRRYQFSLRTLILFVTLAAVMCSWLTICLRDAALQRETVKKLRSRGIEVTYQWVWNQRNSTDRTEPRPSYPRTLWMLLGEDFFSGIHSVGFDKNTTNEDLAMLDGLPGVKELVLVDCLKCTDEGLQYIARQSELEELWLTGKQINDRSMQYFRKLKNLKKLRLFWTKVTNDGLENLNGLHNLQRLSLCGRQFSDASLKYLKKMKQLKELSFLDTAISDKGIMDLQQSLPNCLIE
jgi:hypothetical protein